MDAVTQLFVVEATMESWSRSGRPVHVLTQAEYMFERCSKPGPRKTHRSNIPRSLFYTVHAVLCMLHCACCTVCVPCCACCTVRALFVSLTLAEDYAVHCVLDLCACKSSKGCCLWECDGSRELCQGATPRTG